MAELIAALQAMPQDARVSLSLGGHDYYSHQREAELVKYAELWNIPSVWITDGLEFFEKDLELPARPSSSEGGER